MLDNDKVKQSILDFFGEQIDEISNFYDKYKTPFPMIIESDFPISCRMLFQIPLNNYINKKFNVIPTHIKDWITFEDYVYNMLIEIIKEKKKHSNLNKF